MGFTVCDNLGNKWQKPRLKMTKLVIICIKPTKFPIIVANDQRDSFYFIFLSLWSGSCLSTHHEIVSATEKTWTAVPQSRFRNLSAHLFERTSLPFLLSTISFSANQQSASCVWIVLLSHNFVCKSIQKWERDKSKLIFMKWIKSYK